MEEYVDPLLTDLAHFVANAQADEMASKGMLLGSKETFVQQKKLAILADLIKEQRASFEELRGLRKIFLENLSTLPEEEKEAYATDLLKAIVKINSNFDLKEMEGRSWDQFLGIRPNTMYWIYRTGCSLFDAGRLGDAKALFSFLILLNPLVSEHWLRFGLVCKLLHLEEQALFAFSQACECDPESIFAHLENTRLLIERQDFDLSLIEIETLNTLIEKNNLPELKPEIEQLASYAHNRRSV